VDEVQRRNLQIMTEHISILRDIEVEKVLLLSPNLYDYRFWKSNIPCARFTVSTIRDWNLDFDFNASKLKKRLLFSKCLNSHKIFDLVIAQNVFMYLGDPEKSIQHISKISNYLLFQDLKFRKRSLHSPYFGEDGDQSRYSIYTTSTMHQHTHKLGLILEAKNIVFQLEYEGEGNEFHLNSDPPIHLLALVKFKSKVAPQNIFELYSHFSVLKLHLREGLRNLKKVKWHFS
jgi:hypothetical protein